MRIRTATKSDVPLVAPLFNAYREFYGQNSDLDGARACINDNLILKDRRFLSVRKRAHRLASRSCTPRFARSK